VTNITAVDLATTTVRQVTESIVTPAGVFTAEVAGPADGPLVLFLHGFPQSRHTWQAQQPALAADGWRTVAFDQRGYSPGVRPDPAELRNYHVDRLVDDVLTVATACGAGPGRPFHLVGHDWGGAVAWLVADRHPAQLASLAVLSRPHPRAFRLAFDSDADDQQQRSRHHRRFHDPATAGLLLADGARRLRRMLVDAGVPEPTVATYLSVLTDPGALEAALAWYRAAGRLADLDAGPIGLPTTYLWGDTDGSVGRTAAEGTAAHVNGPYRFVEIAGGGHFLTDDHPSHVTEELRRHLAAWRR
jgi:pimeloyl-ACP methyl ester carboxylesterase